jgi:thiamine monophosphate synthase
MLIFLPIRIGDGMCLVEDSFVEGLHVVEAGLEQGAICWVAIGGQIAEEPRRGVFEAGADQGQAVFQVHRNI